MSRYYIYDSYTNEYAEFAKKKDRKVTVNPYGVAAAGGVAAGTVGGTAAGMAGMRYLPKAYRTYRGALNRGLGQGEALGFAGRSVRGAVGKDAKRLRPKNIQQGLRNIGGKMKGKVSQVYDALYAPQNLVASSSRGIKPNSSVSSLVKVGKTPRKLTKLGVAGLIGAGTLAAGGALAGGYAVKKGMNKRKRDRNSIRGRVRALLGR